MLFQGLPLWLSDKEATCSAGVTGNLGSIPGLGRSPGEGNGIPLQHCYLKNPMDRGAWRTTVHRVTKSWDTTEVTEHIISGYKSCFNSCMIRPVTVAPPAVCTPLPIQCPLHTQPTCMTVLPC